MGCNCSKKKLTPTGNKIVKKPSTSVSKPVVRTSRRTVVRRTAR